ncbi:bestrophin-like domain [Solicola gregarius]|uniref:DUF4239 domain-containing protein n=1 Tax=Solicola gregarius TaxID=2908642 RepID=A0AA46TEF6_9ACTN|nr:DUF4239 domain-containing protein [Solicola gregarius]UYM03546.1 DUF4239 domain-containing protein [Solicola gregarius]
MSEPWQNMVLIVAVAAVIAVACVLVRRALGSTTIDHGSWAATLSYVATAYGVVVGFSIIFLFGQVADARGAVGDEATSIGTAYEQAELFPESKAGIQSALICYARAVPTYDWPAMIDHEPAPEVDAAFHDLVASVGRDDRQPVGALHSGTATNLVSQVGSISTARETRLVAAETQVPVLLWILLLGGGAFVITLIFVVTYPARPRTQAFLVSMATAFTVVMILIVAALSQPFGQGTGRVSPKLIEQTTAGMESTAPPGIAASCGD